MFFGSFGGGWRLKLRQADQAFRDGQLNEAAERIVADQLREYLPGRRLASKIATAMATLATQRFQSGETQQVWRQLDQANGLAGTTKSVLNAQQKLVDWTIEAAENDLTRGATQQAIERLRPLRERQLGGESRSRLEEIAKRLESAQKLSRAGRFRDANEQLSFAKSLRPDLASIQQALSASEARQLQCESLAHELHQALLAGMWSDVLELSDQLLELAPEHKVAQNAKKRAWAEAGALSRAPSKASVVAMAEGSGVSTLETHRDKDTGVSTRSATDRFLLWIDAVGGYLVCLSPEVIVGQAGGAGVDVPVLADLSRRHAKIRREDDAYVLEPLHPVQVEGKVVAERQVLEDGDEISFGRVQMRFRRPHPLSMSARLEFVSGHRTQPSADAILLMAESCVLGPGVQNHVVCRDFEKDVVLFQRDGRLFCRHLGPIEVDGRRCDGNSELRLDSHIAGDDFSLSLEPC